ncbi:hypothetical protein [Bacteroides congonensis]|uniref:hypothetical protein n=1 Tax=Bacteroides congonensis TaxID=1871006 RepID=UPI003A85708B
MALTIKTQKGIYDVPTDFQMEVEITSPIYTDKGSQTLASTLPATKRNLYLADYIHRVDLVNAPGKDVMAIIADGIYRRTGKQNITSASRESGIVANFGFDESLMYEAWSNVSLKKLPNLPVYKPDGGITVLMTHLSNVMRYKESADYYVFPIQVKNESSGDVVYPEFVNPIERAENGNYDLKKNVRTEKIVISGTLVDVKLPAGYGLSPFIRVSKILELIFSSYGFNLVENAFATHYQLKKMVVLNNVADAIVQGQIEYKNMMPDCSVNDFLDALYCRTGAKVFVDGNTKTAKVILIKDAISANPFANWTLLKSSDLVPSYGVPKQLKLSAGTSFEGADVESDSFEEFLEQYNGIITEVKGASPGYIPDDTYICYQASTGRFYKRNVITKNVSLVSSDFFPWNKKTVNVENEEVTGADECLPMAFTNSLLVPQYLAGTVNLNTTLRGAKVEEQKEDTPLCFCFAMGLATDEKGNSTGYYFGSSLCRDPSGNYFRDSSGNTYTYSLVFRGEDGAFNRFFKEWDAILRHSNHTLTGKFNIDRINLTKIDVGRPLLISGQRLMVESVKHSMPYRINKPATVKLRTTKLLKPYDLESEQGIVAMKPQTTKWVMVSYTDSVFEAATKAAEERHGVNWRDVGMTEIVREIVTRPSDEEFAAYLPPSEEDVTNRKEILNTYQAKLKYKITVVLGSPPNTHMVSTNYEDDLTYNAGIRAERR